MISSTINRNDYVGNGSTAEYDYTFKILSDDDLLVVVSDADGVETTLAIDVDYAVSGVLDEVGGTITLLNLSQDWMDSSGFLASGYSLTIRRDRSALQETDVRNQGVAYRSVIEDALDGLVMIDQTQQDQIGRSLKLPETEDGVAANTTLPSESSRASKFLAFDASGNPIASAGGISSALPVSSFAETLLDDASAVAARTTLGAASQAAVDALASVATLFEAGDIKWSARSSPTTGWLTCDGSVVSRTTYAALFTAIGTAFNTGGEAGTTFRLPNLSRRTAVGVGGTGTATLAATLGSSGGAETHTLTTAESPAHSHSYSDSGHRHNDGTGSAASFGAGGAHLITKNAVGTLGTSTTDLATVGITIASSGGGGSHNNIQPSLVLNAFIYTGV